MNEATDLSVVTSTPIRTEVDLFDATYAAVKNKIPFDPTWANGTGYYNGAAVGKNAPQLAPGEMAISRSPEPNNRKIIFVGTRLGNIVVFERYSGGNMGVYVMNVTPDLRMLGMLPTGAINFEAMELMLGHPQYPSACPNFGNKLEEIALTLSKAQPSTTPATPAAA